MNFGGNNLSIWSIADQIICFLYIMLFFWGATIKFGRKNEFNEDFLDINVMKSLRGFAAIGIILHHISQEVLLQEHGILSSFLKTGAYFVAIFFFCSGYGLIKSLDTKDNYLKGFIKNRVLKSLVLPFYVNAFIYGILILLVGYPMELERILFGLTGLTLINKYAWFPIVLAIYYIVFYICFRFIKSRPTCFVIIFVFMMSLGICTFLNVRFAWWTNLVNRLMNNTNQNEAPWWMQDNVFWFSGEWWVTSTPAFLAGLVFANYEKYIVSFFKKKYALKFYILLIITMVLYELSDLCQIALSSRTESSVNSSGLEYSILRFICQIPIFTIVGFTIIIFMMKYHIKNPVLDFYGKYSFHTYLMNLAAITVSRVVEKPVFFDLGKGNYLLFGVSVLALTTLLGIEEQKLTSFIQNKLFKKQNNI